MVSPSSFLVTLGHLVSLVAVAGASCGAWHSTAISTTESVLTTDTTTSITATTTETTITTVTSTPTSSANIIQNPDFANRTISPRTVSAPALGTVADAVMESQCNGSGSGSGSCFQQATSIGIGVSTAVTITLSQVLATVKNEVYALSYGYRVDSSVLDTSLTCSVNNVAGNSWTIDTSSASITLGTWYFVNGTFTGSSSSTNLTCATYVPGTPGRYKIFLGSFSVE